MNKFFQLLIGACGLAGSTYAQTTFPRNGVYDERPERFAFTHATIVVDYQTTMEDATMLIGNGVVEAVGKTVKLPEGIVTVNLKGKRIYPSLIDLYADYGMPEVKKVPSYFSSAP